jgi:hypothetical protein
MAELGRCEKTADEDVRLCPKDALHFVWQAGVDLEELVRLQRVQIVSCRHDLRDAVDRCRVELAAAQDSGSDWWLWLVGGVLGGAALVGGGWIWHELAD